MKKERQIVPLSIIDLNEGQLQWLPKNPRQWTKEDVTKTANSIKRDPDFLEDRPLLLTPNGDRFIVFGGNLRSCGCKEARRKEAPAYIYTPETDKDRETIKRRAMLDNGSFGSWDWDELANAWDDLPLTDWGVPAWDVKSPEEMKLTTEGRKGAEGYDEFVDKFNEELPLTTDDCYTPPEVYEAVKKFVSENVTPLEGRKIVRPFFPGGNYEDLKQYPKGCIVLDNPPFSIFTQIVRFYLANNIDFWLFGPQLTLTTPRADCCYCPFLVPVVYENGAKVSTGFVTNLRPGVRIWVDNRLREEVMKIQKQEPSVPIYSYPDVAMSAAVVGKIANGGSLEIMSDECVFINNLDGMKEIGKGIFGGGFLMSQAAAKRAKTAIEKARVAAEKARAIEDEARAIEDEARAIKIKLSPREQEIVNKLSAEK